MNSTFTGLIAAFALISVQTAEAATVRVFVLAPNGTTSLNQVETNGATPPVFQREFTIPYPTLASALTSAANAKLATLGKSGTEKCFIPTPAGDACPDITWAVNLSSNITFSNPSQPVLTAFGDPALNGINISVKPQMKIHVNISVKVESETISFPLDVFLNIDGSAKLNLWPEIKAPGVACPGGSKPACVVLTFDHSNLPLSGISELLAATGATVGVLVGFTPLGLGIGGPGPLSSLGALLGATAAADAAKAKITETVNNAIKAELPAIQASINKELSDRINVAIPQANKLKDQFLNTKLPGVNKSYQELSAALGLTLDVETTTPSGHVQVIVTPRFSGAAGAGKITGKLRLPKEQCVYVTHPVLGTLPMGLGQTNEDLAAKVGSSCSSLFPASSIKVSGYLGANPQVVAGGGANSLPTWKGIGNPGFTGNLSSVGGGQRSLTQATGYYECGFEISALPLADIIELLFSNDVAGRLSDTYPGKGRYLEVSIPGQQIVLDANWKPVATGAQNVPIGGAGQCGSGSGGRGVTSGWWGQLKDKFDPEKCPQCGIKRVGTVLMITNPNAVLQNPALKAAFDSLGRGGPVTGAVRTGTPIQTNVGTQNVGTRTNVGTPNVGTKPNVGTRKNLQGKQQ